MDHTPRKGLRLYEIDGYSYLEQNPETGSNWAKMAKEGHQIMWVARAAEDTLLRYQMEYSTIFVRSRRT